MVNRQRCSDCSDPSAPSVDASSSVRMTSAAGSGGTIAGTVQRLALGSIQQVEGGDLVLVIARSAGG